MERSYRNDVETLGNTADMVLTQRCVDTAWERGGFGYKSIAIDALHGSWD